MSLRNIQSIVKMNSCFVFGTVVATGSAMLISKNLIHAGIAGTLALIYGLAIAYLVVIIAQERCCSRAEATAAAPEHP